ncbi:MAG: HlyD family efflux transporter periplasmic adaptor subunit [Planctomycetes bacterium]|nr:HlyD family efflux transporter periplasmic adaptor subunit [Planctomycetota bacterium]
MAKDLNKKQNKTKRKKLLRWILISIIIASIGGYFLFKKSLTTTASSDGSYITYVAKKGDLTISVTESGDIKALNSTDLKSEVEGRTTIISIVDEGTEITEEDVKNKMILVELDSADIKERLTQQEITHLKADASLTEAKESLDIQVKQNSSDIQAGELNVRFSLMDFQKYLGETIADKIVESGQNILEDQSAIKNILDDPNLGGEALQRIRDLDGDIYLKEQNLELAKSTYDWTIKLFEKEYISLNKKEADRLDKEQKNILRNKSITAKKLFVGYEFPKEAQKLYSDYIESKRELDRTLSLARSKLAQAQAQLGSNEATYKLQKERLEKLTHQYEACTIIAPATGQVVYSSSTDRWLQQRRPIEIGGEVRERQKIISIPDPTVMKIEIKVHETWIDKIVPGQKTLITIAAFPDEKFTGEVIKKSPLADPENWLNPDLKVYSTDIRIDGVNESLKTGMTGKVEIIIKELKNVISVPIQAVINHQGQKICFVLENGKPVMRNVETGQFNDSFVEITKEVHAGDVVILNPPRISESKLTTDAQGKKPKKAKRKPDEAKGRSDRAARRPDEAEGRSNRATRRGRQER